MSFRAVRLIAILGLVIWTAARIVVRKKRGEAEAADGESRPLHEGDELLAARPEPADAAGALDAQTALDLDLRLLQEKWNRAATALGRQALHGWLRGPRPEPEEAARRREALRACAADRALRLDLRGALRPLQRHDAVLLAGWLAREGAALPLWARALRWNSRLSLPLLLLAPLLEIFALAPAWLAALPLAVNAVASWRLHRRIQLEPGEALLSLLGAARGIGSLTRRRAGGKRPPLPAALQPPPAVAALLRTPRLWMLQGTSQSQSVAEADPTGLTPWLRLLLGRSFTDWFAARELVHRQPEGMRALWRWVAECDSSQAVGACLEGSGEWCAPDEAEGPLVIHALRHPLLREPVPVDIELDGSGWILTGANTTGKTTLLRSIGLASLLGSRLGLAPAAACRGPLREVRALLHSRDAIAAGEGLFLREAHATVDLLRDAEAMPGLLVLLDEPFRGTNGLDRLAASTALVEGLVARGAVVLTTTHEPPLPGLLEGTLAPMRLGDGDERYQPRPGVATMPNALRLLSECGWPQECVRRAREARAGLEDESPTESAARS